jgi:hypothetical protein
MNSQKYINLVNDLTNNHIVNRSTEKNKKGEDVLIYKPNDLINLPEINENNWTKNLRLTKGKDGLMIGSDNAYITLRDNQPITLTLYQATSSLNTLDVNDAIDKLNQMIHTSNDANLKVAMDSLLKYQNYYYLKKYLKYKQKYISLKKI